MHINAFADMSTFVIQVLTVIFGSLIRKCSKAIIHDAWHAEGGSMKMSVLLAKSLEEESTLSRVITEINHDSNKH